MTPAQALTNQIRAATSKLGARLFPMTVGKFYGPVSRATTFHKSQTITVQPGDVLIRQGHLVQVGMKGMSDLVGWITDENGVARYIAVEVKAGNDRMRDGQQEFIDAVNKSGGRAGVARSPEDALSICRGELV